MLRASLFAALALALSAGASAQDDAGKKALKEIEGAYTVVSVNAGGMDVPAAALKEKTYFVRGDQLIAVGADKKEDPIGIALDPSKKPAHIDFEEKDAVRKMSVKSYGIYKFENGTLTLCASESEKPADRPTEFKAAKPNQFLMVLRQNKKK